MNYPLLAGILISIKTMDDQFWRSLTAIIIMPETTPNQEVSRRLEEELQFGAFIGISDAEIESYRSRFYRVREELIRTGRLDQVASQFWAPPKLK